MTKNDTKKQVEKKNEFVEKKAEVVEIEAKDVGKAEEVVNVVDEAKEAKATTSKATEKAKEKAEAKAKVKLAQPKGWKRPRELKPKELGVVKVEGEWKKGKVVVALTRDPNPIENGRRKYLFKILKITNGKQVWGKKTFSSVREALVELYSTFMA